jgi:hypothetical protein
MKVRLLLFIIFFQNIAISKSQVNVDFIEKIQNYNKTVKIIHSDLLSIDFIDTSTFNIKTYMDIYSAIKKINNNDVFDYYYYDNFFDGKPYLFVKNKKFNLTNHINKMANKRNLRGEERKSFIQRSLYCFLEDPLYRAKNNVYPSDKEEGYLQYLFFYEFGELFALKWHANYKKKHIINTKQEIEEILKQYTEQQKNSDSINNKNDEFRLEVFFDCDTITLQKFLFNDTLISIQFNTDNVIIKWLEFEDWRGVMERTYKIMRTKPYYIELIDEKRLMGILKKYIH